jgi:hypothetical protein
VLGERVRCRVGSRQGDRTNGFPEPSRMAMVTQGAMARIGPDGRHWTRLQIVSSPETARGWLMASWRSGQIAGAAPFVPAHSVSCSALLRFA